MSEESNALKDGSPQPQPCKTSHDRRAEHIRMDSTSGLARAICGDCGLTYYYFSPGESISQKED
jgi:hypothetical protein